MAAGLGFKTFVTGDVLTAGDTNGYLMQGVWVFANAAARTAAVTSPQEGNFSYLKDTNSTEYYNGSAWTPVSAGAATFAGCVLTQSVSTQSVATNTTTAITFNTEAIDTDGYHSTVSNTDRITIPSTKVGKYLVTASISMAANTTGARVIKIQKNGSVAYETGFPASSSGNTSFGQLSFVIDLASGDYVNTAMFHTAGVSLNVAGTDTAGTGATSLQATYLGA